MNLFKTKLKRKPITPNESILSPPLSLTHHQVAHPHPQPHPQPHKMLLIPEIVENILSFLSEHTLKYKARLVCRFWRDLSHRHLLLPPFTVIWSPSIDIRKTRTDLVEKLAVCRRLHLKDESNYFCSLSSEKKAAVWNKFHELQDAVLMLCQPDSSLKITQLTIEGNFPVTKTVEQLLQDVPILAKTLTAIRIEKCHIEPFVYIDNILSTCVNLIDLHLEAPQPERDNPVRLELREYSDFCTDKMETPLKLQRLTIKLFWISNRVKEIVLPRCPFVKSLEIVGAYCDCGPPFCRLHTIISRYMPSLEHIHVSSGTYYAAGDKLWVSRQAYYRAKSWSFDGRQINLKTFDRLEMPPNPIPGFFLLEIEPPILTSLEINIGFNGWSNSDVRTALHNYLVSPAAVSLVHLRGDGVTYYYACLDLGKDQNQKLWTCHHLETLHLDIRDMDILKDRDNEKSASVTRSIFGYLTQLLPRIRELRLKFNQFDLDLEGGLCLLKRLRYLESARFAFFKHGQLRERDLYWLDKYPTSSQDVLRQNWIAELQDQLNLDQEALDENDPPGSPNTLKDVIESLKDDGSSSIDHHSENQGALVCLPYLESFVLEDRRKGSKLEFKDPDNSIIQLMKLIRPGCEFRIARN